jgi:hypothetical protein
MADSDPNIQIIPDPIGSTRLTYIAAFLICFTAVPWYVAAVLDLNTAQHKLGVIVRSPPT